MCCNNSFSIGYNGYSVSCNNVLGILISLYHNSWFDLFENRFISNGGEVWEML